MSLHVGRFWTPGLRSLRSRALAACLPLVAVLVLAGCATPGPGRTPPGPTPTTMGQREPDATPTPTQPRAVTAVATATPTPPPPTATRLPPTPTPRPAPTPTPSPTPTVEPTPTSTPRPTPASVVIAPVESGPSVVELGAGVTLTIDPGKPISGRDTAFRIEGLAPWTMATVGYLDPAGAPAQWITDYEVPLRDDYGPAATARLIADGLGAVSWRRIGTRDRPGGWTLRLAFEGAKAEVTYPVVELPVQGGDTLDLGVPLHRYVANGSDAYYADGVPVALVVDLQGYLAWAEGQIRERYGLGGNGVPTVHFVPDHEVLATVGKAIGQDVGWEAGFYVGGGARPGIYMEADALSTSAKMLLTHEYAHLALDAIDGDGVLPTWLDEGIAVYLEREVALRAGSPTMPRRQIYEDMALVKQDALAGTLLSLVSLENRDDWNAQTDQQYVERQYAEAHAAVRYLTEQFGFQAVVDTVRSAGKGETLDVALQGSTGETYQAFQQGFQAWVAVWEDPERAKAGAYIVALGGLLMARDEIVDRRDALSSASVPLPQRRDGMRQVVADLEVLDARLEAAAYPPALAALREEAVADIEAVRQWLSLELEYLETRNAALLDRANAMLPEVNGRNNRLTQSISAAGFAYMIED